MTTHAYLNEAAQRSTHGCTSTQYLWDGLAVPNPNLRFMLSGHVHDESRRTDIANGHPVYQMLADYQERASGGEGWLRILRFVPAEDRVYVQTYSPWLNAFETDANSEFTLDFPMGGAFAPAGSATRAERRDGVRAADRSAAEHELRVARDGDQRSGKSRTGPTLEVHDRRSAAPSISRQWPPASRVSMPEDTAAVTLGGSDPGWRVADASRSSAGRLTAR